MTTVATSAPHAVTSADVARFRAGDPDGVRAVYRAYHGLVFAVARSVLQSRELAEEAAQHTFVKAWKAAAGFDPTRDLGPWLATIARRAAIDIHRRESRRMTVPLERAEHGPIELPVDADMFHRVWTVRAAVDDLNGEEREVMRLTHVEQLTQIEIAARLEIPLGTVKSRCYRAHRHLAARLGHLAG